MTEKTTNKQLVIVGNGFDIAHGLNTSFYDFSKTLPNKFLKKWGNVLTNLGENTSSWYSFEELISKLTLQWFLDFFYEENRKKSSNLLKK